jgi:hypothetical protein
MTNEKVRDLFQEVADWKTADDHAGGTTGFDAAALAAKLAGDMRSIIE